MPDSVGNDEVEGRVVHREERPQDARGLIAIRPRCVPGLLRCAEGDEGDLDLAGPQERNVLTGSLCRPNRDRQTEVARQDPRQTLAVAVIRPARRRGADGQGPGPVLTRDLLRRGQARQQDGKSYEENRPHDAKAHGCLQGETVRTRHRRLVASSRRDRRQAGCNASSPRRIRA